MEEEEQDYDLKLYRTDGFWYRNAFKTLSNFVNKLKVNIALSKRDLPFDIETMILTMAEKDQDNYIPMHEQIRLLQEYNTFINIELKNQLAKLKIRYDESDIYINVINYAKANGLNLRDKSVLLNEVLPWLGTTDWSSNTGGRSKQLSTIEYKIKTFRGGKINNKKSRKLQKRRYISKKK